MQVWIGTSGYSYPDWVGAFYPPGTRPEKMLGHYVKHFPLVELNFTFYRLPTPSMLERIATQTPAGFQFLVKLPRTLSHDRSPRELDAFRYAVEELRRREQLLGLLCQLPQATHDTRQNRTWLQFLGRELQPYGLAVEFRHQSWSRPDVAPWLAEQDVDLVSVDAPDIPALYPRGLVRSTPRLYVRLHSRNAQNWYKSDKDRYDFDYDDAALQEWITSVNQIADSERILLLFNNCQRTQAVANAQRMRELLLRTAPHLQVVEPFAQPEPGTQQRLLFD